jgi:hypothetical protein
VEDVPSCRRVLGSAEHEDVTRGYSSSRGPIGEEEVPAA